QVGIDCSHSTIGDGDRARFRGGERGKAAFLAHALQRLVEYVGFVERENLRLVGEQKIDFVLHETAELLAVARDAEGIRKRERNEPPRAPRDLRGPEEGFLRAGLLPDTAPQ